MEETETFMPQFRLAGETVHGPEGKELLWRHWNSVVLITSSQTTLWAWEKSNLECLAPIHILLTEVYFSYQKSKQRSICYFHSLLESWFLTLSCFNTKFNILARIQTCRGTDWMQLPHSQQSCRTCYIRICMYYTWECCCVRIGTNTGKS